MCMSPIPSIFTAVTALPLIGGLFLIFRPSFSCELRPPPTTSAMVTGGGGRLYCINGCGLLGFGGGLVVFSFVVSFSIVQVRAVAALFPATIAATGHGGSRQWPCVTPPCCRFISGLNEIRILMYCNSYIFYQLNHESIIFSFVCHVIGINQLLKACFRVSLTILFSPQINH